MHRHAAAAPPDAIPHDGRAAGNGLSALREGARHDGGLALTLEGVDGADILPTYHPVQSCLNPHERHFVQPLTWARSQLPQRSQEGVTGGIKVEIWKALAIVVLGLMTAAVVGAALGISRAIFEMWESGLSMSDILDVLLRG